MRQILGIVKDTITCLKQGANLIARMSKDHYSQKVGQCFNFLVGEHFRHIIDHYTSLMDGTAVDQGAALRIDCDSRRRDKEVELNPKAGIAKVELICSFLETQDVEAETQLEVKMDTGSDIQDQWAPSTLLRELQFLLSHTVLAAAVPFLAVITLLRALRERFDRHRAIARWTLPIWLYVSVTGVAVYWMLYRMDL